LEETLKLKDYTPVRILSLSLNPSWKRLSN